jgi:hypothetical protein
MGGEDGVEITLKPARLLLQLSALMSLLPLSNLSRECYHNLLYDVPPRRGLGDAELIAVVPRELFLLWSVRQVQHLS